MGMPQEGSPPSRIFPEVETGILEDCRWMDREPAITFAERKTGCCED